MNNPKILFIATFSFAGMGPYVASIVNSFKEEDNVYFFLVEKEDKYYSRNLKPELRDKALIITERTLSKIRTLYNLVFNPKPSYFKNLIDYCNTIKPDIVHDLTSLMNIHTTKYLFKNFTLIDTIHDLHPHEAKKSLHKQWSQDILYKRIFKCMKICHYYNTNSQYQFRELQSSYSNIPAFYTNFPTLITDEIKYGNQIPTEIKNENNYILFFGRIEAYKGVEILIDAFLKIKNINNTKLVIAGKGECNRIANDNIIYINRYIDDKEIAELYKRASCVVYPYISATQSGVLSVAAFFKIPIIASDIHFFREELGNDYPFFFSNGNSSELEDLISNLISNDVEREKYLKYSSCFYNKYNQESIRINLLKEYQEIMAKQISL